MLRPFLVRQHVQVRTSEEIHLSHLDLSARLHHVERQRHDAGGLHAVTEHAECRQIRHSVSRQAAFYLTRNMGQTLTVTLLTAPESAPDMKLMEKLACEAPECWQSRAFSVS